MAALLVGVTSCRYGCHGSTFYRMTFGMVGILVFPSNTLGIGTKKSSLRKRLVRDGVSVGTSVMVLGIVLVEPSDSALGSSSKMGSIESLWSYQICTMLITGANWSVIGRSSSESG